MRINLNHQEIQDALVHYVGSQGIDIQDKEISVEMTAGRKNNGYSASIEITQGTPAPVLKEVETEVEYVEEEQPQDVFGT